MKRFIEEVAAVTSVSRIIALTEKVLKFIFGFLLSIFHIFPFYDDFYSFAMLTNEIEHQI